MKKIFLLVMIMFSVASASYIGEINSVLTPLTDLRWELSYEVRNLGSEPIEELTIWFDYDGYSNFAITTVDSQGWDEILIASDSNLKMGVGYDILNTANPLLTGQTITALKVAFDYTGDSTPSLTQTFEIIDSSTFATLYTSTTIVPEPFTIALLGIGGLVFRRGRVRSGKM